MTCITAACVYLSWTGNRPRPVCHIHAPYPSSSARPAHPCLGYCASSPPPSPPSWNQTDKNLNCRPPTSRLCPVCHIHVPYPSSPARPPHPCIGSRAPPSPTSPPVYAQVTQTYFFVFGLEVLVPSTVSYDSVIPPQVLMTLLAAQRRRRRLSQNCVGQKNKD